jgi:hypothetical protein
MTEFELDDNLLTFGKERQTFGILEKEELTNDYTPGAVAGVTIMMSLDKVIFFRRVYSIGDWMNEVGGYSSLLLLAGWLILPLFKGHSLDKYLVYKLYKMQEAGSNDRG